MIGVIIPSVYADERPPPLEDVIILWEVQQNFSGCAALNEGTMLAGRIPAGLELSSDDTIILSATEGRFCKITSDLNFSILDFSQYMGDDGFSDIMHLDKNDNLFFYQTGGAGLDDNIVVRSNLNGDVSFYFEVVDNLGLKPLTVLDIKTDSQGNIYTLGYGTSGNCKSTTYGCGWAAPNWIDKFSETGNYIEKVEIPEIVNSISSIEFDSFDNLYIIAHPHQYFTAHDLPDIKSDKLIKISPEGRTTTIMSTETDNGNSFLAGVFDMDIDSSGNIYLSLHPGYSSTYVMQENTLSTSKFDANGNLLYEFETLNVQKVEYDDIFSIEISSDGRIYTLSCTLGRDGCSDNRDRVGIFNYNFVEEIKPTQSLDASSSMDVTSEDSIQEIEIFEEEEKPILSFVDQDKDPSHYVKRYTTEPNYTEWFDTHFSDYTIWEGIGISQQEYQKIVEELSQPKRDDPEPVFKHTETVDIELSIQQVIYDATSPDGTYVEYPRVQVSENDNDVLIDAECNPKSNTLFDTGRKTTVSCRSNLTDGTVGVSSFIVTINSFEYPDQQVGAYLPSNADLSRDYEIRNAYGVDYSSDGVFFQGKTTKYTRTDYYDHVDIKLSIWQSMDKNATSDESWNKLDRLTPYDEFSPIGFPKECAGYQQGGYYGGGIIQVVCLKDEVYFQIHGVGNSLQLDAAVYDIAHETLDLIEEKKVSLDMTLNPPEVKMNDGTYSCLWNGYIYKNFECVKDNRVSGGGCLIATAAFGSEMAPQIQFLREIRDNTVMSTQSGTAFMTGFNQFYYSFSPQIADYERENPVFKEAVKVTLTPLLTSLTLLNYVDIDSEEEMLGYGIGIILLNIGMYFVAPAVLIISLKKRLFI